MNYKPSHIITLLVLVSVISSWLTATVVGQSPVEKAKNRAVRIETDMGSCSGVILQTNLVMTCSHCLGGKRILVNGHPAQVYKEDKDSDLALLIVHTIVIDRVLLAEPIVGDDVFSWGYPMSSPNLLFTKGYVAVIQVNQSFSTTISMPGSSGSGLYNSSGQLVGIVSGYLPARNNAIQLSSNVLTQDIRIFWENK